MAEALEKWDLKLIDSICPDIARIIINIDKKQQNEGLKDKSVQIIQNGMVNMAYLACYVCKYINGVASLHTELLKSDVLSSFLIYIRKSFKIKQTELLSAVFFDFAILNTARLLQNCLEVTIGYTIYQSSKNLKNMLKTKMY